MARRKLTTAEIAKRKRAGAYHDGRLPLSAKRVQRLKGEGRFHDALVPGLYLQVTASGARSWLLRFELNGKERMMGLGSAAIFMLAHARERAREARRLLADGIDPLASRHASKQAAKLAEARKLSFGEAAQKYFNHYEGKWTNAAHRDAFLGTLRAHAFAVLGDMDVATIDTPDIHRVLDPIWKTKSVTADRVRSRIEQVIDWCTVRGYRAAGTNPARWVGHLEHSLAAPRALAPIQHHPALPYAELPGFMVKLRQYEGSAARALEFLILTAARSREVTGARWDEINFADQSWTVPAARMKGRKEHRVPLTKPLLDLLRDLPREDGNPFVFVGNRPGEGIGRIGMAWLLGERMGVKAATIHGFRSTFRDWAGEQTSVPPDICEAALAHARGDKTVQAYARGDLFNKRRKLMEAWARFCATPARAKADGNVVAIGGGRRR
jgi:integrase